MNDSLSEPVVGKVDVENHLICADPMLLRLHLHCGGHEGGRLAIPQLADICQRSRRLNMKLARLVTAADDDEVITMWVETQPSPNKSIDIKILDWQSAPFKKDHNEAKRRIDFEQLDANLTLRTDAFLRIVSVSPSFAISADEIFIGKSFLDLFDFLPPSQQTIFTEAIAERQPIRDQRVREVYGKKMLFLLSGQPLIDVSGMFSGYRLSITPDDIKEDTEHRSAQLIGSNLFGTQLGPALRQPLGKIIANAETIGNRLEGPLRADYAEYAKDIANAGRHLMELVNDMSDLEAIDRPDFKAAGDDVDLVDLAERAAGLLAVKAADHQIRIDLPAKGKKVPATGEFRRILQVLVNLIGNAIRYSPDGSLIKVTVEENATMATISVTDQGNGVSQEDHEKIFNKFERLGRSGDGGSGLGLYISRRLATAMDGTLTVESSAGRGATFTLAVPARHEKSDSK